MGGARGCMVVGVSSSPEPLLLAADSASTLKIRSSYLHIIHRYRQKGSMKGLIVGSRSTAPAFRSTNFWPGFRVSEVEIQFSSASVPLPVEEQLPQSPCA